MGNSIKYDVCEVCAKGFKDSDLRRCTRCRVTVYCGSECQRKDWKVHKQMCQPCE